MNKDSYLMAITPDASKVLAMKVNDEQEVRLIWKAWQRMVPEGTQYQIGFITTPSAMSYVGDSIGSLFDQARKGIMPSQVVLEFVPLPATRRPQRGSRMSKAEIAFQAFCDKAAVNDENEAMILFCEKPGAASAAVNQLKKAHPNGFSFASRSCTYNGQPGVGVWATITAVAG